MTLAAGPDRMVSIGLSTTRSALASEPSPFTIMSRVSIISAASDFLTAAISATIRDTILALSVAVSARRGPSSASDRSLEIVTGASVYSRTIA